MDVAKVDLQKAVEAVARAGKKHSHRVTFVTAMTRWLQQQKADKYAELKISATSLAVTKYKIELPLVLPDVAGGKTPEARKRAMRQALKRQDAERLLHFARLRKVVPAKYLPLVERAAAGSRSAGVKLVCLDCANYCVAEVRHCTLAGTCPLWSFRPYQPKK